MEAKRKITAALDDGTGDYIVQKILFPDIFGNYDLCLWVGVISLVIASIASFTIREHTFSSRFYKRFAN